MAPRVHHVARRRGRVAARGARAAADGARGRISSPDIAGRSRLIAGVDCFAAIYRQIRGEAIVVVGSINLSVFGWI